MGSSDPFLSLLKEFSYNAVRLPRTDIRPLQVLQREGNELIVLGELKKLFIPGAAPLPRISRDKQAVSFNGKRTRALKLSVGLSLLGNLIKAMTGSALKLDLAYQRASAITYEFDDVKVNDIDQIDLHRYLAAARVDPATGPLERLLEDDKLYVITSTVKSRRFSTLPQTSSGTSVAVDVPVIRQAVGASVGVTTSGTAELKITYEGPKPLIFGLQAAQIEFERGRLKGLKQVRAGDLAARRGAGRVEARFDLFESSGPFVRLKA